MAKLLLLHPFGTFYSLSAAAINTVLLCAPHKVPPGATFLKNETLQPKQRELVGID